MLHLQLPHELLDAVPLEFNRCLHGILAARGLDGCLYDYGPLAVIPSAALDGVLVWQHVMIHEASTNNTPDLLLNDNEVRDDLILLLVDVSQSVTLLGGALELIRLGSMMLRGILHLDHGGPLGWDG